MSRGDICAKCAHFTLDGGKPDEGIGQCTGITESGSPARWDEPFCVLFRRAQNMAKREQWIAMRRREEDGNTPAA